ncbi:MAG: winged helix-turn-helix domain-containing protein [bacterium]
MFRFDQFRLDIDKKLLYENEELLDIEPKIAELLCLLVQSYPETVSRQTLMDQLWPRQEVSDASLAQLIRRARVSLADNGKNPRYIKTVHGIGLRWLMEKSNKPGKKKVKKQHKSLIRKKAKLILGSLLILAVAGFAFYQIIQPQISNDKIEQGYPKWIAVLPIENNTGDIKYAWVKLGMMDMVGQLLNESAGLLAVQTKQVLSIPHLDGDENTFSEQRNKMLFKHYCEALGCDLLLRVSVSGKQKGNKIHYQIISRKGSFKQQELSDNDTLAAANAMVNQIVHKFDPAQPWLIDVSQTYSNNQSANQAYALGVQALFDRNLPVAKQYLQIAVKQEPGFNWAQVRLAEAEYYLSQLDDAESRINSLLFQKNLSSDLQFQARHVMSNILYSQGKLSESLALSHLLLEQAFEEDRPVQVAQEQMNIGTTLLYLNKLNEADVWLKKASSMFKTSKNIPGQGQVALNQGNLELTKKNESAAMRYYQSALSVFKKLGNITNQAICYSQIANIKQNAGDFKGAQLSFEKAIEQYRKVDDLEGELLSKVELITLDLARKHPEKVIGPLLDLLQIIKQHKLAYVQYFTEHKLVDAYLQLHEPDKAEQYLHPESEFMIGKVNRMALEAALFYEKKQIEQAVERMKAAKQEAGDTWTKRQQRILSSMQQALLDEEWKQIDY